MLRNRGRGSFPGARPIPVRSTYDTINIDITRYNVLRGSVILRLTNACSLSVNKRAIKPVSGKIESAFFSHSNDTMHSGICIVVSEFEDVDSHQPKNWGPFCSGTQWSRNL